MKKTIDELEKQASTIDGEGNRYPPGQYLKEDWTAKGKTEVNPSGMAFKLKESPLSDAQRGKLKFLCGQGLNLKELSQELSKSEEFITKQLRKMGLRLVS